MSGGHRCLVYDGESRRPAVTAFLSEGLSHGDQAAYFGWGSTEELRRQLGGFGDGGSADTGMVVVSLDEAYSPFEVPDPEGRLAFWVDATERALAAGFDGFRAVTDTTPWLGLPEQRRTFLRSEQLIDRYVLSAPLTLLCSCDGTVLAREALSEIVAIHRHSEGHPAPFCLHATTGADYALDGEVDAFTAPLLERVMSDLQGDDGRERLVIDARGVQFIDHTSLLALERYAERTNLAAATLHGLSPSLGHVAQLLNLRRVQVDGHDDT
jgi:anti-anti-sigma regulatory factor